MSSINIIAPTYNRPSSTEAMLDSVLLQSVKPAQMTIVDAGSTSANYEKYQTLFEKEDILFSIVKAKPGLTHQRNVGIDQNHCDVVLFLDDDVELDTNYVACIQRNFENDLDRRIGGVTGKITNQPDTMSVLSKIFRKVFFMSCVQNGTILPSGFPTAINYQKQKRSKVQVLSGCNMAYRAEVFKTQKFDENLARYAYMEDVDFSFRVSKNFQLYYEPEALLKHNIAPQERLKDFDRYRMLVHHHHYLFRKNISLQLNNIVAHTLSLIGIPLQALLLKRSYMGFKGSCKAMLEIIIKKKVFPL